jgi:hypothetical protein
MRCKQPFHGFAKEGIEKDGLREGTVEGVAIWTAGASPIPRSGLVQFDKC